MALFFKKSGIAENRIENSGRWPVRVTQFQLIDEYEFPATNFPEIFFVQEGNFLHETGAGTQAVREGVAMMVNPGQRHTVKQPDEVVLTRVRFLPEWLTREYDLIIRSPNVLSLFFDSPGSATRATRTSTSSPPAAKAPPASGPSWNTSAASSATSASSNPSPASPC